MLCNISAACCVSVGGWGHLCYKHGPYRLFDDARRRDAKGRIVAYPHKTEDVDALSLSLYELLDEGIQQGGLQNMLKMIEYVK